MAWLYLQPITSSDPQKHDYGRQQLKEQIAVQIPVLGAETVDAEAGDNDTPPEEYSQFLNMSLVTPDSTEHDTQSAALDSEEGENRIKNQKPQVAAKINMGSTIPSSNSQMDAGTDSQSPQGVAGSRVAKFSVEKTHPESASLPEQGEGKHAEAVVLESESGAKGSTGRGSELPWEKEAPSGADDYIVPVYTRRAVSRQQKEEQRAAEGSQEPGSRAGEYDFNIQMEGLPREEAHVKKREGSRVGRKRKGDTKADGKENEDEVVLPKPKRRTKAKQTEEVEVAVGVAEADTADGQLAKPAEAASKRQVKVQLSIRNRKHRLRGRNACKRK